MAAAPPLVGLTCYAERVSWGAWHDVPAALVPQSYIDALRAAGAQVLLVPPEQAMAAAAAERLVRVLDALVVAGGVDVDPAHYGQPPHPVLQPPRPDRDDAELALVRAATEADLPMLGVCRGMQVMAVAAGGSLEQHLPDRLGTEVHSPTPGRYGSHGVRTAPSSRLRSVLGERVDVPTHHHQGVASHPGYQATAWADDGVLEGMEALGARWRVGVQWHPEVGTDPRIFEALVAAIGVPDVETRWSTGKTGETMPG
jgi:putative glutamine amidotransferase